MQGDKSETVPWVILVSPSGKEDGSQSKNDGPSFENGINVKLTNCSGRW